MLAVLSSILKVAQRLGGSGGEADWVTVLCKPEQVLLLCHGVHCKLVCNPKLVIWSDMIDPINLAFFRVRCSLVFKNE